MFVCICNALNETKVHATLRDLSASGCDVTPAAIHRASGCKPQCGRCLPEMADMIDSHRTASAFAQAAD